MRTLRVVNLLAIMAVVSFAARTAYASDAPLSLSEEALLYNEGQDLVASAQQQRSLLQAGSPRPPAYCSNSHIKPVFTARIAVLLVNNQRFGTVSSGNYVSLVAPRLTRRFNRYNRAYRLNLGYTISQLTSGVIRRGQQKWYFYDIKFVVGNCGLYKFPLITQLRGEIQPSAPFIKRNRLVSYPFK